MTITLNGTSTETDASTIAQLLESLNIPAERKGTAVAVNDDVVPRSRWNETALNDGDRVEVIRAAQGG